MSEEKQTCELCGEPTDAPTYTRSHGDVCLSCLESFSDCANCDNLFLTETLINTVSGFVCEDCFADNFTACSCCGSNVENGDAYYCDNEDTYICDRCYDDNYFTCYNCELVFSRTQANEHIDDEYYCDSCFGDVSNELVHDYHYKPLLKFFGTTEEEKLNVGFELEVEAPMGYALDSMVDKALDICPDRYIHAEHDGSLSYGFELVSMPQSYKYIKNAKHIKTLLTALKEENFKSHDTETCGLHFHISRDSLRNKDILNLICITDKFFPFLFWYSRRKAWTSYSYRYQVKNGKHFNTLEALKNRENFVQGDDRYFCINLRNRSTIEFRFFRGTLKYNTFLASVDMVYYMLGVAKKYKDISDIYKLSDIEFINNFKNFSQRGKAFIEERNKHKPLNKFLVNARKYEKKFYLKRGVQPNFIDFKNVA